MTIKLIDFLYAFMVAHVKLAIFTETISLLGEINLRNTLEGCPQETRYSVT